MAKTNIKKEITKEPAVIEAKKIKSVSLKALKHSEVFTLIKPRVTEKASFQAETKNVYTFEVSKTANKYQITKAVKDNYKVRPLFVRIASRKAKKVIVRGKSGVKAGGKKAYVYLKKGDKIEFV